MVQFPRPECERKQDKRTKNGPNNCMYIEKGGVMPLSQRESVLSIVSKWGRTFSHEEIGSDLTFKH